MSVKELSRIINNKLHSVTKDAIHEKVMSMRYLFNRRLYNLRFSYLVSKPKMKVSNLLLAGMEGITVLCTFGLTLIC